MDVNRFEKCLGTVLEDRVIKPRRSHATEPDLDEVSCFMRNFGTYQKVILVPILLVLDDIPEYLEKAPEQEWDDVECIFLCKNARKDIEKGLNYMGLKPSEFVIPMSANGKKSDPSKMKQGVIFCSSVSKMNKKSYINFFKDARKGKLKKKKVKVRALNLPQNGERDEDGDEDWVKCKCARCKKSKMIDTNSKMWDCSEGYFDEPRTFDDLMKLIRCNKYSGY